MNQPDIEIYLKDANAEDIESWLSSVFGHLDMANLNEEQLEKGVMIKGSVGDQQIPVVITPKAAGKAFTSIWFQSDQTGWKDDLTCAESFISHCDKEVRCSSATWTEAEAEDSEMWWYLKGNEKKLVRWG